MLQWYLFDPADVCFRLILFLLDQFYDIYGGPLSNPADIYFRLVFFLPGQINDIYGGPGTGGIISYLLRFQRYKAKTKEEPSFRLVIFQSIISCFFKSYNCLMSFYDFTKYIHIFNKLLG